MPDFVVTPSTPKKTFRTHSDPLPAFEVAIANTAPQDWKLEQILEAGIGHSAKLIYRSEKNGAAFRHLPPGCERPTFTFSFDYHRDAFHGVSLQVTGKGIEYRYKDATLKALLMTIWKDGLFTVPELHV